MDKLKILKHQIEIGLLKKKDIITPKIISKKYRAELKKTITDNYIDEKFKFLGKIVKKIYKPK